LCSVTISAHISSSLTLPARYSAYRKRAQSTTSGGTNPLSNSQLKKPSPASPLHRVPSQSKAANSGLRAITESRNSDECRLKRWRRTRFTVISRVSWPCELADQDVGVVYGKIRPLGTIELERQGMCLFCNAA